MNCAEYQDRIFEGELDRDVIAHLTECEECRSLEHEVRLNSTVLAELREEVIPVRVRQSRRWPWVAAIAVAAAVFTIVLWPSPPHPVPSAVELPVVTAGVTPPHALPVLSADPPPPQVKHVRPKPKLVPVPSEPLMVKFFTDDPDIVIYWLIDPPKGEVGL